MQRVRIRSQNEIEAEIRKEREQIQALQVSIVEWRTTLAELQENEREEPQLEAAEPATTAGSKGGDEGKWQTRSA